MSHLQTWRRWGLWLILLPATRGRSRHWPWSDVFLCFNTQSINIMCPGCVAWQHSHWNNVMLRKKSCCMDPHYVALTLFDPTEWRAADTCTALWSCTSVNPQAHINTQRWLSSVHLDQDRGSGCRCHRAVHPSCCLFFWASEWWAPGSRPSNFCFSHWLRDKEVMYTPVGRHTSIMNVSKCKERRGGGGVQESATQARRWGCSNGVFRSSLHWSVSREASFSG